MNTCKALHPDAQLAYFREKVAVQQGLTFLYLTNDNNTWIAVKQFNSSGDIIENWFWADQVPLFGNATFPRYFQWGVNEPNSGSTNRCGSLLGTKSEVSDDPCTYTHQSLCEVHGTVKFIISGDLIYL
jgi:hypothetical protein